MDDLADADPALLEAIERNKAKAEHSHIASAAMEAGGSDTIEEMEEKEAAAHPFADDSLALEFGRRHRGYLKYIPEANRWYLWTGKRWKPDGILRIMTKIRSFIREKVNHGGGSSELAHALKNQTFNAVEKLTRSNIGVSVLQTDLDRDPMLLGTPDGTVDLRTGKLRQAELADLITKATAVTPIEPGTPGPELWMAVLNGIFSKKDENGQDVPDTEFISYLQRVLGSALCGEIRDQALFFFFGQGANGKGVVLNTITAVLGDYAQTAPADMFLVSQHDRHPTELARLQGARLVVAQEMPPGKRFDTAKLKSLTGGDRIAGRFMRGDYFEFSPQFTLIMAGNTKPGIDTVDEAMRRRVHLLPFAKVIPPDKRDPQLTEKLKKEHPAILRWMIEGCLEWQKQGLNPPLGVLAASQDYLAEEDVIGQWLEECCELNGNYMILVKEAYASWKQWAEEAGAPAYSAKRFSKMLTERGHERWDSHGKRYFLGLRVRDGAASSISMVSRAHARTHDTSKMADGAPSRTQSSDDWDIPL